MDRRLYAFRYGAMSLSSADAFTDPVATRERFHWDFSFWLIADDTPMLVDTGFDSRTRVEAGRRLYAEPARMLYDFGFPPSEIRRVALTHLHYDHAGCLDLFPHAEIYLQRAELDWLLGPAMRLAETRRHYRAAHIAHVLEASSDGRLILLDGDFDLGDGVTLRATPGHTPGQQAVAADLSDGPFVFASDGAPLAAHLALDNPFPNAADPAASRAALRSLATMTGGDLSRIAPGHDRLVSAHPGETPQITQLTAHSGQHWESMRRIPRSDRRA